ncbi:hypothetical protein GP2143_01595 [marine gamma proteobacterium HTCC2143]|uniref:HTH crp-type domain-containing protein n=1 Tax=marine gamma proteobacterium HTCC2143 TaxID=247633 RepID=A0YFU6_9GAMM|nr:hypothetical protein GP2143_01595 [marine gamma proteobacterium HTCC2143]
MNLAEVEHELLERAIQAFHTETGLLLDIIQEQVVFDRYQVDAIIKIPKYGIELGVEVKRWAQQANLGALADQIKRMPIEGILVADYINPNMARRLKTMDVQFIDAAGNAYLNQPPVYVHVTGNKKPDTKAAFKEGVNRAFDATGLKVVYGFLCNPELVDATYREIAERTGVALGTIGRVLNGLTEAGFIVDRGKGKGRRLVKKRRLLDRWVEAYPEKLKPKQRVGEFTADDPYWWEEVHAEKYGAYWGGEIAAAKYTNYLKPETVTLYLPEYTGKKLLARARLRKLREGEAGGQGTVRIYRPFWPVEDEEQHYNNNMAEVPGVVNPILAYADLIATGDSRNLETARMIYEQYIAKHIGED